MQVEETYPSIQRRQSATPLLFYSLDLQSTLTFSGPLILPPRSLSDSGHSSLVLLSVCPFAFGG